MDALFVEYIGMGAGKIHRIFDNLTGSVSAFRSPEQRPLLENAHARI